MQQVQKRMFAKGKQELPSLTLLRLRQLRPLTADDLE